MWDCSLSYSLGWIQFGSLCFSFGACFVPFNSQPKLVEICSPWTASVLSGRAELCWGEGIENVLPRRGLGPAEMQKPQVFDEIFVVWMLKQQCFKGWAWGLSKNWNNCSVPRLCVILARFPNFGLQRANCNSCCREALRPKFCASHYYPKEIPGNEPAAGKWDLVLPPNCSSINIALISAVWPNV